ncbi:T9SS type A sorting domain-containing protein [Winogradskyella sp. R77965]|uniref:T9SS type A sorting domain-containing protein n=1 Tax=Winogradskyella sp. R77965 TaxID=3093872 RepID=UPI0037DD608C
MRTLLVVLIIMSCSNWSNGQSIEKFSIDSGGSSTSEGGIQILYTIGEVNVQEYSNATISISEGFINCDLSTTLGINDAEVLAHRISIYPNPTDGIINIETNYQVEKIEVFSILGRKIRTFKNITTLDLSHEAAGIYLLKINVEGQIVNKKIVLQ